MMEESLSRQLLIHSQETYLVVYKQSLHPFITIGATENSPHSHNIYRISC